MRIPVIANGDIADLASAQGALRDCGAAGVMVGRAARGRPWLLAEIAAGLGCDRIVPRWCLTELVGTHYEEALSFHGRALGLKTMRKHLGWYLDIAGAAPEARDAILREPDPGRAIARFRDAADPGAARAA